MRIETVVSSNALILYVDSKNEKHELYDINNRYAHSEGKNEDLIEKVKLGPDNIWYIQLYYNIEEIQKESMNYATPYLSRIYRLHILKSNDTLYIRHNQDMIKYLLYDRHFTNDLKKIFEDNSNLKTLVFKRNYKLLKYKRESLDDNREHEAIRERFRKSNLNVYFDPF